MRIIEKKMKGENWKSFFFLFAFTFALATPCVLLAFEYAGSNACRKCHEEIYDLWKKTPHAKIVRPLKEIPLLSEISPEKFEWPVEKIKYGLGSHYVHRFVAEASGTLIVLPGIFDISKKSWLAVRDYGWQKRFYPKQCAGCHNTGFNPENDTFVEPAVGCESCHGPALNHVRTGSPKFVVNPASLPVDRKNMVCESCHTSGVDNSGQYCFPIGFTPGEDLTKFFVGLTPKPGQDGSTFLGDETYEDRHRQWEFFKSRHFLAKGLTCNYCQNFRNFQTASGSDYLTHDQFCLTCHSDRFNHPDANPGKDCITCHSPKRTKDGSEYSIHDHKFSFGSPK